MKKPCLSALALLAAGPALAHPGHGAPEMTHWLQDIPHLAVIGSVALLAIVVIGGLRAARRRKEARDEG